MAEERDFNEILDDIVLIEHAQEKESYKEGFQTGVETGNAEGFHLGYHKGFQLGRELGYYMRITRHHLELNDTLDPKYSDKILKQLQKVQELIEEFPQTNSEEHDILKMAETIRAQFRKACSLLKISSNMPYDAGMDSKITHLRQNLDTIITFLTPYLPLANCHMVEFFTESHWECLLPSALQQYLDKCDFHDAVNIFWSAAENNNLTSENEISKWVQHTHNHCLVNKEYCLTRQGLQNLITSRGSNMQPEIKVTEFMNSKKSYEVQSMSAYVASLHNMCGATHCVEAGGGKGHLLVALSLGYQIPSLTIDCDAKTLRNAEKRVKTIQKQWHAIATKINQNSEEKMSNIDSELHKFAPAFITKDTDLTKVVRNQFECETVKLLLTGLHTCGNLGPDSLRLFTTDHNVSALFNVPCCYHLLSEEVDAGLYDVFQRDYGGVGESYGFPMSEHLRGFNLGRNARMLAAQSIERVTSRKELPNRSLLYRALLQEIIKKYSPQSTIREGKLKGISCQSFEEYLKTADAILNIGLDSCQIPETIDCKWKKMVLFYLVRLCLAQVVESVILMDRLLFLYENGFSDVFLVKLFDPVLSPRCHSIVAIR